jgi:hypothetical protein
MNESWADTRVSNGILRVNNEINGMFRINNESLVYNGTYDTNDLVISTGTSPKLCTNVCSYTSSINTSSELKPLKFLPL